MTTGAFRVITTCSGCGRDHMVRDCVEKEGKASVHLLSIIPSKIGVQVVIMGLVHYSKRRKI